MKTMKIAATMILLLGMTFNLQASGTKADKPSKKNAPTEVSMLKISDFTSADLQIVKQRHFDASPAQIWKYVSDSKTIPLYFKQVKKVNVDNSKAVESGVGTERMCSFGGDQIHETVVHVEDNSVFAYQVKDNDIMKNHLAIIRIEKDGEGSKMTWYQFFDKGPKGMKASMMKMMMPGMLKKGMKNLDKLALQG